MKQMIMEEWQLDFEWLQVRHYVKDTMERETLPNLNAILYLIGIQELGRFEEVFTKEQKQDLMHIAICELLGREGYYSFEGRDADGWPHYKVLKPFQLEGVKEQEQYLKERVIKYFSPQLTTKS